MFEQTFVDGVGKTKRPYTILLSFAMQIVMIGVLVIIPLIYYDTLKGAVCFRRSSLRHRRLRLHRLRRPSRWSRLCIQAPKQFVANQLIAPKSVPQQDSDGDRRRGSAGDRRHRRHPGRHAGLRWCIERPDRRFAGAAPPKPPPAPPAPPKPTGPAKIGGNVVAANLINPVKPVYPPLAKMARQQGTVKFEATISKEGTIEDLKLISGPPLLVQAAMEAVKQWRYRPTHSQW